MGYYMGGDSPYRGVGDPGFFDWLKGAVKTVAKFAAPVLQTVGKFIPGVGIIGDVIGGANNLLNGEAMPPPAQAYQGGDSYNMGQAQIQPGFPQPAGSTFVSHDQAMQEIGDDYDPDEWEEVG